MARVNNTPYSQQAYQNAYIYDKNGANKETAGITQESSKAWAAEKSDKTSEVYGIGKSTYGNPELSEKGKEYYSSLVKKYGHLNFVLVSSDKKQEAEMMKGSFASSDGMTVLIDTDKIEQMARDDSYRTKYESILNNAQSSLSKMQNQLSQSGASVKAFGMTVKDGRASFFAVMDKSMSSMRDKAARKRAEKAEAKKEEAQKAEKANKADKANKKDKTGRYGRAEGEERLENQDTETVTADSMEELLRKVQDYYQQGMLDHVRTEEEMMVGGQINFGV